MIPVQKAKEPACFDERVRQPGQNWLAAKGHTRGARPKNLKLPSKWTACANDFCAAYHSICAYSAIYIQWGTGAANFDHFKPVSKYLEHAYEWDNYRLAAAKINQSKRDHEDVVDPFEVEDHWFQLNLCNGTVVVNHSLDKI